MLDLGCRSGALTKHFLEGNTVVGLDVDASALEKAAALGIEPVQANVEEPLPFEDASFDAVVAGELFEHLQFPDALVAETGGSCVPRASSSDPCRTRSASRADCASYAVARRKTIPRTFGYSRRASCTAFWPASTTCELSFVGGRYAHLHARLLARDLVFRAVRP